MTITSDEVNFLVYRYLQESGFVHTAFTFAYESQLVRSKVVSTEIPPGALISFLQKGLLYVGIEAHVNEDGTERECEAEVSLLNPHICHVAQSVARTSKPGKRKRSTDEAMVNSPNSVHDTALDAASSDPVASPSTQDTETLLLRGHEKDAFSCLWKPAQNTIVSGSSDSSARIWSVNDSDFGSNAQINSIVLPHGDGPYKDVTTLEWNRDGSLIASGSYDGHTRLWTPAGELKHEAQHHHGPVFAVRWSPSSQFLLSAGYDSTVALYDVSTSQKHSQVRLHDDAAILDASWKDDTTFATCSADATIRLTNIGEASPFAVLRGHSDEINSIKWNAQSSLLASCSDDCTVKVWKSTESNFVWDFKEHSKEVYTIRWSPTGAGSNNPNRPVFLASSSFDTTVKLWDVDTGKCLTTHTHDNPVYAIAFSPNGEFLASGTINGVIHIYSLQDGAIVKTYRGKGDIFEVNWSDDGKMLSACFSTGDIMVIHFRV